VAQSPVQSGGRWSSRVGRSATLLGVVGAAVLLIGSRVPLCPVARLTGCPCPGCGLTRATLEILRGNLSLAFALQPFAFLVSPLLASLLLVAGFRYWSLGSPRLPLKLRRVAERVAVPIALIMVVFWALRFAGFWAGPVPV
jgi:hypothetical protein